MHHGKHNMDVRRPAALLPDHFFTMPRMAHTTMTTPELREVLLKHDGQIIARGELWTIRNKHIGAGVHRVYLMPAGHNPMWWCCNAPYGQREPTCPNAAQEAEGGGR